MTSSKTLILSGYGLNCERETEHCCRVSGGQHVDVAHFYRVAQGEIQIADYDFLVFIGGFLDGDDLGAGRVGANRMKYTQLPSGSLQEQLQQFIDADKLILGICNGFQVMVKLGLLPALTQSLGHQEVSLTSNAKSRFEDRWVNLTSDGQSSCVFTKNIDSIYLPIRHGEGRIEASPETLKTLQHQHQIPLQYADATGNPTETYPENPNGSPLGIAALSNERGTLMGMMPHPEAFNHYTNHPQWTRQTPDQHEAQGLKIFQNAYDYLGS